MHVCKCMFTRVGTHRWRYAYMHVHMCVRPHTDIGNILSIFSLTLWGSVSQSNLDIAEFQGLKVCSPDICMGSRLQIETSGTWLTVSLPDKSMGSRAPNSSPLVYTASNLTTEPSPQPILSIFLNDESNIHQVFLLFMTSLPIHTAEKAGTLIKIITPWIKCLKS